MQPVTYLDQEYPELVPQKYAVGIVNVAGRFQQNMSMSPDGSEQLFTVTDAEVWRYETILRVRKQGEELVIDTPQFVKDFSFQNEWFIGEAMISPDNQTLFFVADYPPDIWQTKRTKQGEWGSPTKLDSLNTEKDDWYPTLSQGQTLYFTNGTVYQAQPQRGEYVAKSKVESPFTQRDTRDPCISPNGDYMIFSAEDSLGYGKSDLFVSFKDAAGNWSEAQNLGQEINTEDWELAPYISPDEKFLFFSRRDAWQQATSSNIYWVSLEVVLRMRQTEK